MVTLTGTNLLNASTVRFGSTNAISFTVVSATQITATAPPGTGSSPITVITPGGTSNPVAFTYAATPTLTALVPSSGPTSAGTVVTLTGTNLASASAVTFGVRPPRSPSCRTHRSRRSHPRAPQAQSLWL